MKRIYCLLAILSLLMMMGIAGCESSGEEYSTVSFEVISQGDIHGGVEEGLSDTNLIITDNDAWNDLLNKMDETLYGLSFSEEDIDFSKYQIIAVFDVQHGNGGWSIDITNILEHPDKIVVSVRNLKTGNIASVITNPYQIVKVSRSEKQIEFNRQ